MAKYNTSEDTTLSTPPLHKFYYDRDLVDISDPVVAKQYSQFRKAQPAFESNVNTYNAPNNTAQPNNSRVQPSGNYSNAQGGSSLYNSGYRESNTPTPVPVNHNTYNTNTYSSNYNNNRNVESVVSPVDVNRNTSPYASGPVYREV
jgi:hypothetical protein